MGKGDTLLNVALEAVDGRGEELLLLVGDVGKDVDGLLNTIGLQKSLTESTWNVKQVDLLRARRGPRRTRHQSAWLSPRHRGHQAGRRSWAR